MTATKKRKRKAKIEEQMETYMQTVGGVVRDLAVSS